MSNNEPRNIPRHVALIMDGNGRWAKERGRERVYGHINGVESMRKVVEAALRRGVRYLTVYAFSTENWGRPAEEVRALMELLCKSLADETGELDRNGVRIRFIGDIESLSPEVKDAIVASERTTRHNDRLTLVIAVNYSSRWEITHMARTLASEVAEGRLGVQDIDADRVSAHLLTAGIPDPDLLIRTSSELRLSNFLLWQLSYTELYFTDTLWPDFDGDAFDRAIDEYARRERRYGVLKK